jgi:hypothetical protein
MVWAITGRNLGQYYAQHGVDCVSLIHRLSSSFLGPPAYVYGEEKREEPPESLGLGDVATLAVSSDRMPGESHSPGDGGY